MKLKLTLAAIILIPALAAISALLVAQTTAPRVVAPSQISTVSGNGGTMVTTTGPATAGNAVVIDANGNHVDSGVPLIQARSLTLTAAQVDGMFAAPVLFLPAQGPGTVISLVKGYYNAVLGSAAFAGGGTVSFYLGNATPPVNTFAQSPAATFLTSAFTANEFIATNGNNISLPSASYANTAVYVSNVTAPYTGGGTSTLTVTLLYYVLAGVQ
jgi:hypothetical protein